MKNKIAIMGCGWLGLPLAKSLIKKGYLVNGSTTRKLKIDSLKNAGIEAYLIALNEDGIGGNLVSFFEGVSTLIINIPPKLRGEHKENYIKKMQLLHDVLLNTAIQKILFASSTAVYGNIEGEVTEETPPKPSTESGKQLLCAENIFKNTNRFQTTILRLGGLIGKDRHPITILSGRKDLAKGQHPINLIHCKDCIQIIEEIIKNDWWDELFNAVFPYHPKKSNYYTSEAKKRNIQLPDYKLDNSTNGKKVLSNRLINVKNYTFTTPLIYPYTTQYL